MWKIGLVGCCLISSFACGVSPEEAAALSKSEGALGVTAAPAATAKLKCRNIGNTRWQICGDVSRNRFVFGAGVRFYQPDVTGSLVAVGAEHPSCEAALQDPSVPSSVRGAAAAACGRAYADATGALDVPVPVLVDQRGASMAYGTLTTDQRRTVDEAAGAVLASNPGTTALGCAFGPGLSISCWGGGKMCAAWIDEDGAGSQCWTCEIADCT